MLAMGGGWLAQVRKQDPRNPRYPRMNFETGARIGGQHINR
jgi:hypothetical protein